MGIIKQDKSIFNIFRNKDKVKEDSKDKKEKKESKLLGNLLFISFVLAITFGFAHILKPYLPPRQLMAFKIITGCIGIIIFSLNKIFPKKDDEEVDEYEDNKDEELDSNPEDEENQHIKVRLLGGGRL